MNIFFISDDKILTQYVKDVHKEEIRKFLYWEEGGGLLVAGGGFTSHHGLRGAVYKHIKHIISSPIPVGAGNCEFACITGWSSFGFELSTPDRYRQIIRDALGIKEKYSV